MAAPININICNFGAAGENIIQTGNIDPLIQFIAPQGGGFVNGYNTRTLQINQLMHCLSQTLALEGQYKGNCECALKERIYQLTLLTPEDAKDVANGVRYISNEKLNKVIKKINYLSKGWLGKFAHQLGQSYFNNVHKGTAYFIAGANILLVGSLSQAFSENDTVKEVGLIGACSGAALMVTPLFTALYRSFKDKP